MFVYFHNCYVNKYIFLIKITKQIDKMSIHVDRISRQENYLNTKKFFIIKIIEIMRW